MYNEIQRKYHRDWKREWFKTLKQNPEAYAKFRASRRAYHKQWRDKNFEHVREYRIGQYWKNIEKSREISRNKQRKLRQMVLEKYGGKCACCGITIIEFLTIDHIDGKNKHIKSNSNICQMLKKNNYPNGFRVLCYNCNCALGHFGYCPHQKLGVSGI